MSAMRRLYGGPVAAILGVDVVFAALQARDLFSDPILGLGFVLGRMTMLVTDCVALVWLGTWAALGRGGPLPAAGAALARVLIVPWVILLALLFAAHLMEWEGRISDVLALATWFIVGVANNAYWTVLARWRLPARFRAVSDPWRSKHGWLRRWASLG
jgi:hypothetical protein